MAKHWTKSTYQCQHKPYQLQQSNFTTRLSALLAAHQEVNPYHLELEILETSALNDIRKVTTTMKACQN